MDNALIAPTAALLGVLLGGLINVLASTAVERRRERAQDRRERRLIAHELQEACAAVVEKSVDLVAMEQVRRTNKTTSGFEKARNESMQGFWTHSIRAKTLAARCENREVVHLVAGFVAMASTWEDPEYNPRTVMTEFERLLTDVGFMVNSS